MKTTAFTLGLVGGMLAIPFSFLLLIAASLGHSGLALILALLLPLASIVGAALTPARPRTAAKLMGGSAVVGLLFLQFWYALPGVLLAIAAVLAWRAVPALPAPQVERIDA